MSDISSSVWRTAYFSAIFETDPAKLTLNIAGARAASTGRLNSPIEISRLEHEAIEAARLKTRHSKTQADRSRQVGPGRRYTNLDRPYAISSGPSQRLYYPLSLRRSCCSAYRACCEALDCGGFGIENAENG